MKTPHLSLLAGASLLFLLSACGGGGGDADREAATAMESSAEPRATVVQTDELPGLAEAVGAALVRRHAADATDRYGEQTEPVVEAQRRSFDGDWVFGGAWFPIPAHVSGASPVNSLFVAQRRGQGWEVTLETQENFHQVLAAASDGLSSPEEKRVFAMRADRLANRLGAAAGGRDIGLSLPYRRDDPSWGTWGVHGDSGSSRPYNAIDFMAGDGRVLASRGGLAYKFCTKGRWPFIKVVHDNGFTTGYYHLRNTASIDSGQRVSEGDFLGLTGTELPCGGSATGDHVHWSLWRGDANGRAEPVDGKVIGGWTWHEAGRAYSGHAERGDKRVSAGGRGLVNFGHGGTTPNPNPDPSPNPPPRPSTPCSGTGCSSTVGRIDVAGRFAVHPEEGGFEHRGGPLKAWLMGPQGSNFDLILGRYNPRTGQWDRAAASEGSGPEESINWNAAAGRYRWRVSAISGKGTYTLWTKQ